MRDRYEKITHGGESTRPGFALTVDTEFALGRKTQRPLHYPVLRRATPGEYLERMALFNRLFDDDVQVDGVIGDPGRTAIVTSQPTIEGRSATRAEIDEHLQSRDYLPVPGVVVGRGDSITYFRAADNVVVFDTHMQNFKIDLEGSVAPIDALVAVADEYLANYLSLSPAERQEEIGTRNSVMPFIS